MKPLNVLLLLNDLQPYGSQRVAIEVARQLSSSGENVKVCTLERPRSDDLRLPESIDWVSLGRTGRGLVPSVRLLVALFRQVRRDKPDVVHSHMTFSNLCALFVCRVILRRSVVITEHNVVRNLDIERNAHILRWAARLLYPKASKIICVTSDVAASIQKSYQVSKVDVQSILNPVDVEAVISTVSNPPHRWLYGNRSDNALVCVGGFREAKGQDVLIRALARTRDARAIFVGDGASRVAAESLAESMGVAERIDFVGYQPSPESYMAYSKAVVIPSRWEGFGLVAVEAAAVGARIIASEVEGLRSLIPNYVQGILVDPDDPRGLAEAIESLERAQNMPQHESLKAFYPEIVGAAYRSALRSV